jgi:hypothetical protein
MHQRDDIEHSNPNETAFSAGRDPLTNINVAPADVTL